VPENVCSELLSQTGRDTVSSFVINQGFETPWSIEGQAPSLLLTSPRQASLVELGLALLRQIRLLAV
jgi:hypothetical protein